MSEQELRELLIENEVNADSLEILWKVDCEQAYGLTISGEDAIAQWHYFRQLVAETGHYPILIGGDNEKELHAEAVGRYDDRYSSTESPTSTNEIIEAGLVIDPVELLNSEAQAHRADWEVSQGEDDFYYDNYTNERVDEFTGTILGSWLDNIRPSCDFSMFSNPTSNSSDTVILALIPAPFCWQVPAFLRFGGWNGCPFPEEHIALMRRWYEIYGAEVVGITHDEVEMLVAHPPTDRAQAFKLAQEQYLYCNDIVAQVAGTLNGLAATLLNGSVWYFWWD